MEAWGIYLKINRAGNYTINQAEWDTVMEFLEADLSRGVGNITFILWRGNIGADLEINCSLHC